METELRKYIRSVLSERFFGLGAPKPKVVPEDPWAETGSFEELYANKELKDFSEQLADYVHERILKYTENVQKRFALMDMVAEHMKLGFNSPKHGYEAGRQRVGVSENSMDAYNDNDSAEQIIAHIIDDVVAGKTSKQDAVESIVAAIEMVGNYAHRATIEPHLNEKAEEIDEERITNDEGKEFASKKENFIGSHCWGEKLGDGSYVVMSYGKQFPLYIFWNKKNKWYENSDHYIYDGEPQESTEEHRADLRPTDETRKKQADWMKKLSNHLLKVNGISDYEHISVEPGTKN